MFWKAQKKGRINKPHFIHFFFPRHILPFSQRHFNFTLKFILLINFAETTGDEAGIDYKN